MHFLGTFTEHLLCARNLGWACRREHEAGRGEEPRLETVSGCHGVRHR